MTHLSRPCYDKPHRCPGWAGGGMKSAKADRCPNGRIGVVPRLAGAIEFAEGVFDNHPGAHPLRFGHCNVCDITTWPYAIRYVDPAYLRWRLPHTIRGLLDDLRWKAAAMTTRRDDR